MVNTKQFQHLEVPDKLIDGEDRADSGVTYVIDNSEPPSHSNSAINVNDIN